MEMDLILIDLLESSKAIGLCPMGNQALHFLLVMELSLGINEI